MTTYTHIAIDSVRRVLEAGPPEKVTQDLTDAVWETYEAWADDQHNEDIEIASLDMREDAVNDLDELQADHINFNSDASPETIRGVWNAIQRYWTN